MALRSTAEKFSHDIQGEKRTRRQSTRIYIEDMVKELMDMAKGSEIEDLSELLKMTVIAIETKGRLGLIFPDKKS